VAGWHVVDNVELFNASARYMEQCFLRNLGKFETRISVGRTSRSRRLSGLAVADRQ
jgi:hypothetical protein